MPNTINGVGQPYFTVLDPQNGFINDYIFPRCNVRGLEEESTKEAITHVLEYKSEIIQRVRGYRTKFVLDYSQWLRGTYALMLGQLLNDEQQGMQILFNPRMDALNRQFKVMFSNAPILLGLVPSGSGQFIYMRGVVIELITTTIDTIRWIDADQLEIALDNFAVS